MLAEERSLRNSDLLNGARKTWIWATRLASRTLLNTLGPPPEPDKADNVKRPGAIGKRSYYSFPNGVEAEDICRYLSFNLGNVVRYACRAGRMDGYKKIEDLEKAKDYLDNEIERLKEEFDNEIQGMKDKIAKQKKGDD